MEIEAGSLIGGRFEVEAPAGSGGMAVVFRARDRHAGGTVALKVLRGEPDANALGRFDREAALLGSLSHPRLVRLIEHGRTALGQAFIALEWLEGETLAERLRREPLRVAETLALVRGVAEALAEVHRHDVIHRDVKPSNIFLVGRDPSCVKVLDFGIARLARQPSDLTGTGAVLGTFAYMSPEQAGAFRRLEPTTDVFSLGCVLFLCLTGRKPFEAEHAAGVLVKIVLEDAPRLAALRPDLPRALDELVSRMMAKEPTLRPPDGAALLRALDGLGRVGEGPSPAAYEEPAPALTSSERRVVTVLIAPGVGPPAPAEEASSRQEAASTVVEGPADARWRELSGIATDHGARQHALADGTVVASFASTGSPLEHALKAARYALRLRALAPLHPVALATGLAQLSGDVPVGDVIDRAVRAAREGRPGEVLVDEVTAGLLGGRFELGAGTGGLRLLGERDPGSERRELLGRPTPLVGRRRELGALEDLWDECVQEEVARVALVTAPAGLGKSRLRFELLAALAAAPSPPAILLARADPLTAGAPLGLLGDALRRAAQLRDGEAPDLRHRRLRARLARGLSRDEGALERCATFLGELAGAPAPRASAELEAARADPRLMGDRLRAAFEEWVEAELREGPLVFVLEDLQWGDGPSVAFLDGALGRFAERGWLVLGLARPEVHDRFPGLFAGRDLQEITLTKLTRRAASELVRHLLDPVAADVVERLVEVAGGNAFYLEELIRAVATGAGEALPPTVLAMVQARLESVPEEGRRILRAASIFGKTFYRGGVAALLGGDERTTQLDPWLDELVSRELVTRRPECRFPGDAELVFRHALVREGAYGTLTDEDRARGHRLAAAWLERAGEQEPFVLAVHHAAGGDAVSAAPHFVAAAEDALRANDLEACVALAERAVVEGVPDELRGRARLVQAEASRWRGRSGDALAWADEARRLLAAGTAPYYRAATEHFIALLNQEGRAEAEALAERVAAVTCEPQAEAAQTIFVARAIDVGRPTSGPLWTLWERARTGARSPLAAGWIATTEASRAFRARDPHASMVERRRAVEAFERLGDLRTACLARVNEGHTACMLGDFEGARAVLRRARAEAGRMGLEQIGAVALHNQGLALARLGLLDEGLVAEREALAEAERLGHVFLVGYCRAYEAEILIALGRDQEALEAGRLGREALSATPAGRLIAEAVIARAAARLGLVEEALARSEEALALLAAQGADEAEAAAHLSRVEALDAAGRTQEARETAARGVEVVQAQASKIVDPDARERFLRAIPEHVALAARLAEG